jgi:hypothetical protein
VIWNSLLIGHLLDVDGGFAALPKKNLTDQPSPLFAPAQYLKDLPTFSGLVFSQRARSPPSLLSPKQSGDRHDVITGSN